MLYSVAARFHFSEVEIINMPLSRLIFWYNGHVKMCEEERGALDGA